MLFLGFGQLMAHDMSQIQEPVHKDTCCTWNRKYDENIQPSCYPIHIDIQDPMFIIEKIQCLNFTRAQTDADLGCKDGKGRQINSATAALDLSPVYSTSSAVNDILRVNRNGLMKTEWRNGTEFLPIDVARVDHCTLSFMAGDSRSDQNPVLAALQLLLIREHNRIARELSLINPHWNDLRLFHESRRILIAQYQYICYYEWLPLLLGRDVLLSLEIINFRSGYVNDYCPSINPGPSNEYAHAAFVYLHSNIPDFIALCNSNGTIVHKIDWSGILFCQDYLLEKGKLQQLWQGMITQPMAEADTQFSTSTRHNFDRKQGHIFGSDLRAMDIQRARDVGLRMYQEYREFCGADVSQSFADFGDVISQQNLAKLEKLYHTMDAVELIAAASVEAHIQGSAVGPTFECILTNQFIKLRKGDYLWFEHKQAGFTLAQLKAIKSSRISSIMCHSAQGINKIQPNGFAPASNRNPKTECSKIPGIDLTLWKEDRK